MAMAHRQMAWKDSEQSGGRTVIDGGEHDEPEPGHPNANHEERQNVPAY